MDYFLCCFTAAHLSPRSGGCQHITGTVATREDYFQHPLNNAFLISRVKMSKLVLPRPLVSPMTTLTLTWVPLPLPKSLAQQIFEPARVNHEAAIFI